MDELNRRKAELTSEFIRDLVIYVILIAVLTLICCGIPTVMIIQIIGAMN